MTSRARRPEDVSGRAAWEAACFEARREGRLEEREAEEEATAGGGGEWRSSKRGLGGSMALSLRAMMEDVAKEGGCQEQRGRGVAWRRRGRRRRRRGWTGEQGLSCGIGRGEDWGGASNRLRD